MCREANLRTVEEESHDTTFIHHLDLKDVKGQAHARRALEIAAAGGHNYFLSASTTSTSNTLKMFKYVDMSTKIKTREIFWVLIPS